MSLLKMLLGYESRDEMSRNEAARDSARIRAAEAKVSANADSIIWYEIQDGDGQIQRRTLAELRKRITPEEFVEYVKKCDCEWWHGHLGPQFSQPALEPPAAGDAEDAAAEP